MAYAVFGRVTAGMDVVDTIAAVAVGNRGPFQNVPNTPVEIISITVQTIGQHYHVTLGRP